MHSQKYTICRGTDVGDEIIITEYLYHNEWKKLKKYYVKKEKMTHLSDDVYAVRNDVKLQNKTN